MIEFKQEELVGGHSIARHGFLLQMFEMEQRVLGTHPTLPQCRSALKFLSEKIHEDTVKAAYSNNRIDIEAYFKTNGGDKEWTWDLGTPVGEGFTNLGSRKYPISYQVNSTKVQVVFRADPSHPRGFFLLTAFPLFTT